DEVGTSMWRALTGCETVQCAYQVLLDEYDVDPEVLRSDLSKLLEELVAHGLLELDPA
ncbi:MAG: PqqD family protein, partial [Chloroflexi bacterium]|nr:PqqD family protein [Chloroflexota bacterium]